MSEEIAAPVVQDAAIAQEPSTPTTDVNNQVETPEGEGKPEKTPEQAAFEKRIARQTAANRETQRQLQEERAQREAVQKRLAEYEAKLKPLDDKPTQDNFDSVEDYAEALADWKLSQKAKEQEQKAKEPDVDKIVEERLKQKEAEIQFRSKEDEFRKVAPDYDKATEVVNGLLKHVDPNHDSTKAFAATLMGAPNPPALIHYLGTNPAVAISLMQKSPFEIADTLGEIIDRLSGTQSEEQQPSPKALPTPPSALRGSTKVNKSPEEMSGRELLNKYMPKGR